MREPRHLKSQLVILGWTMVAGALAGLVYVGFLASMDRFPFVWLAARNGLLIGATITGIIGVFEMFVWNGPLGTPFRRQSFPVRLVVKTLVYTSLIAVTLVSYDALLLSKSNLTRVGWLYVIDGLAQDTVFAILVTLLIQFVMQMRRLIGGRVLTNVVLGRYNRPREEHRVFMFVDLVDSTLIARRLGDIDTHALISRVFFDLDAVIVAHGGEVHRYVGDQVVVTWPFTSSQIDGRCLRCAVAMRHLLERRAFWYQRRFGLSPAIRVGLNAGPVVAGECGETRVEIVYFGDTVNLAARLEQTAKTLDRWLLVPTALIDHLPAVAGWTRAAVGPVTLKGCDKPIHLCTLEPTPAPIISGTTPTGQRAA